MQRQKLRKMHYSVVSLYDGTVLSAYPIRKPTPKMLKSEKRVIDEDGISREFFDAGKELSDVNNKNRTRFQDIISVHLNICRTIRKLIFPSFRKLEDDIQNIQTQLDQIKELLIEK